jgi:hypothetical protein
MSGAGDHPNIVPVYETGSTGTIAYIAALVPLRKRRRLAHSGNTAWFARRSLMVFLHGRGDLPSAQGVAISRARSGGA